MSLEKEIAAYRRELPKLLDKSGKFALVQGDSVVSVWDTYEDALQEGYKLFRLTPFMVKQIQAVDLVHTITRGTPVSCPS